MLWRGGHFSQGGDGAHQGRIPTVLLFELDALDAHQRRAAISAVALFGLPHHAERGERLAAFGANCVSKEVDLGMKVLRAPGHCFDIRAPVPSNLKPGGPEYPTESMAANIKLPADSEVEGNVWCDACQQSLIASRATTHLGSKKHAENSEALAAQKSTRTAAKKTLAKKKAAERGDETSSEEDEPAKKPARKRADKADKADKAEKAPRQKAEKAAGTSGASSHGLRADPNKAGNYYCGICRVSLTPSKAESHLDTARHRSNEDRTLSAAMQNLGVEDDE